MDIFLVGAGGGGGSGAGGGGGGGYTETVKSVSLASERYYITIGSVVMLVLVIIMVEQVVQLQPLDIVLVVVAEAMVGMHIKVHKKVVLVDLVVARDIIVQPLLVQADQMDQMAVDHYLVRVEVQLQENLAKVVEHYMLEAVQAVPEVQEDLVEVEIVEIVHIQLDMMDLLIPEVVEVAVITEVLTLVEPVALASS